MACTCWAVSASTLATVDAVGWRWTISRARLGPGDDGYLVWGGPQQLIDDLAHALAGADFDAFDERDDDGRFRDETVSSAKHWRAPPATG